MTAPRSIAFPLLTARVTIRAMCEEDAPALHEVYADPTTMRFLTSQPPTTLAETREWVRAKVERHERTGLSLWTVVDRATGAVLGDAGLQHEVGEYGDVGIGGRLARRHWRRGYGLEVGQALLEAGFDQLGLSRIVGVTRPGNDAARAVCERLGMRLEGLVEYFGSEDGLWAVYAATRPSHDG